jgi:ATP dependent DNA ligase domain
MAFDLLYHDRRDLTARPLRDRRARLEDAVVGSELVFPVRRFASDGLEAWAQVLERTPEGYVAKDEGSAYEGRTTRSWLPKTAGLDRREDRRMAFRMPVKPPPRADHERRADGPVSQAGDRGRWAGERWWIEGGGSLRVIRCRGR